MPRCPECKKVFRVMEDELGMHDCPYCGHSPNPSKQKIRYTVNVIITREIEEDEEFPPSNKELRSIERDIILYLERAKLGSVDCEITDTSIEEE